MREGEGFPVDFDETFACLKEEFSGLRLLVKSPGGSVYLAMCNGSCLEKRQLPARKTASTVQDYLPVFFLPKHCTLWVVAMMDTNQSEPRKELVLCSDVEVDSADLSVCGWR